jgi:FkbM family methyltransferase
MRFFNIKILFIKFSWLVLHFLMETRRLYWNLPVHGTSKIFSIKVIEKFSIRVSHWGDIAEILYVQRILLPFKKSFEYSTFKLSASHIKKNDVIIDVGANIGLLSIFYSKLVGTGGRVFSFEPGSPTFNVLLDNIKNNRSENITSFHCAVSDKESEVMMDGPKNESGQGDAYKYMLPMDQSPENRKNIVKSYPLDSFDEIMQLPAVNFIKIDVEGAELLVLKGAEKLIRKFRPLIIFEMSGEWTQRFNYKPYEVFVLLNSYEYEMDEYEQYQWIARPK